jgi:RimJ/RimL family protein N-acetyltransferase
MTVLETDRLTLRRLTLEDAPFILELVNEPSWIKFIGDRGVRTLDDARAYARKGPIAMYEALGFGLYATQRKSDGALMGLCGLIKREFLKDFDLGFAFLPRFWDQGYAREAAAAVLTHAKEALGLARIVAIASLDNERSIKLLESLGFQYEEVIKLSEKDPGTRLFARTF